MSRLFLKPFMKLWVASTVNASRGIPRPSGPPQAHTPGSDSDRVLLFGAGPTVGWGVGSHDLALAGSVSRALSARTGRASTVDVIVNDSDEISKAVAELATLKLWKYDAIIIALGLDDALQLTSIRTWRRELANVLALVAESRSVGTVVAVAGVPPIQLMPVYRSVPGAIASAHATAIDFETKKIVDRFPDTVFVPLEAGTSRIDPSRRHRCPDGYTRWGRLLAADISPLLASLDRPAPVRGGARELTIEEEEIRQDSVDAVYRAHVDTQRLDRIVEWAQRAFHTESAVLTVLDHGQQRYLAHAGLELPLVSRAESFCDVTIRSADATIVKDAHADDRFADKALVTGDPHIRFYAGFPIEAPSGERIGALCVLDPTPRTGEHTDVTMLRELSLLLQNELWRSQRDVGSADSRADPEYSGRH